MQKPDDIPEDVWATAEALAKKFREDGYFSQAPEPLARAILAERERLTDPEFLAKHMEAVGLVDAEWKTRCEIAEADRADMAETIRRLEVRTLGLQLVG